HHLSKKKNDIIIFCRSHHNATLLNPGPPALYRLNTERKRIDETETKVNRWTYGQKKRNKQNKVILMVGETGAGKTTMINTLINYLLGEETSVVTVYEVFVEENPTSLTIIDTPGYGHTEGLEKDREISEYLIRLFSDEDGIQYIDAVCFVMKATQNRLSRKEHYIVHSVLSLFGRDIENNIVFLLTHSDGGPPTNALNAIKKAEIPCRRDGKRKPIHFLFNNRQKEIRDKQYEHNYRSSWEMGARSMNEFFTFLEEKNRKSVWMTLDVMKERIQLEACVSHLKDRICENELKNNELTQIQEALAQNRDKIQKFQSFQFTVKRSFKEKVPIENEWGWNRNATCCNVCQENCHEWNCWWVKNLSWCEVMKSNHCTVCTGKCHYSKHVRENKKYVIRTKEMKMAYDDLKLEYEHTGDRPETSFDKGIYINTKMKRESIMKESENKTETEENLKSNLEKIKHEKSIMLHEAYISIVSLCKISLKADSASTLQHLDFLILRLKEEKRDKWIKNLEDLKKTGDQQKNKGALRHLMDYTAKN
uniref:Zgc:171695 n=1 Tax=Sinocyclocheilus rhinocerous TaxID=307959 RepID=A0A673J874_9TELE